MKLPSLYSKQNLLEVFIVVYFLATLTVLFQAVSVGEIWGVWVVVTLFVSSGYLSLMGFYATLKKQHDHSVYLLSAHILLFVLSGVLMSLTVLQFVTLILFALVYNLFIYRFLRVMHREVANRIFFVPRRIVFPYIQQLVLGFILITSVFVYFQIARNTAASEGVGLPETLITSQSQMLTPVLQQFEPSYQEGMTVEELLTVRLEESIQDQQSIDLPPGTQLVDVPESVRDQLIDREVSRIEEQYSIDIDRQDDVLTAVITGINGIIENLLGEFLTPVVVAGIASLFVFFGLLSLMPIYAILIKTGIASTSWIFVRAKFIELEEEVVTKHIMKV